MVIEVQGGKVCCMVCHRARRMPEDKEQRKGAKAAFSEDHKGCRAKFWHFMEQEMENQCRSEGK